MWQFLLHYLVYPSFEFMFGWLGDHLWVVALLVALAAVLIWRFLWPFVTTFNTLFGWKGWALIGVFILTFGSFGAGWRAHRDSIYPLPEPPAKPKKKVTKTTDTNPEDSSVLYPGGDDWLKRIFNGNQY